MAPDPALRLAPVVIDGPAGPLECLLAERENATPRVAALVCHPHPLYGGTMHNKVVHRAAAAFQRLGAVVLRFNFRGTGASAGKHDRGAGELEDARAAMEWLERRYPSARLWLAGFSFGSWIAARLAAAEPAIERVVLIAPPVRKQGFETMRTAGVPKLVVQGTADTVCTPEDLFQEFPAWAEPKQLVMIEGASHFFDHKLGPLGDTIERELRPVAPPA